MSRSVVIALDTRLVRIVNLQEPINAGASIIVPRGGSKVIISHQPRRNNRRPLTIRDISDKRATRVKEKKRNQCISVCASSRLILFLERNMFRRKCGTRMSEISRMGSA